ncbi:MAG TPA: hypothetical protein VG894_12395 [Bauldia sp.]|nr:hypothetical protein [Bauldia sp.]
MPATAVTYPATGEALARVPYFGAAENDAITSAHAPFIVFDHADDDGVDEFLEAKYMLIGGLSK